MNKGAQPVYCNKILIAVEPLPYDAHVRELVGVIEEILDKQIAEPLKHKLFSVLLKLQVEAYENVRSDE